MRYTRGVVTGCWYSQGTSKSGKLGLRSSGPPYTDLELKRSKESVAEKHAAGLIKVKVHKTWCRATEGKVKLSGTRIGL